MAEHGRFEHDCPSDNLSRSNVWPKVTKYMDIVLLVCVTNVEDNNYSSERVASGRACKEYEEKWRYFTTPLHNSEVLKLTATRGRKAAKQVVSKSRSK